MTVKKSGYGKGKERKFKLPPRTRFDMALLPIIQNLVAAGMTESDIGAIVGYQGKNADDWLNELKRQHPEVMDAYKAGRRIADSIQVAEMYKSAIGYDYQEVEEEYKITVDPDTGEEITVKTGAKVKHKHQPGNAQLAIFLATNRMPDQFKNRIEATKKSFIINGQVELSGDQIERLAGKLFDESRKVKQIESTVVEAVNVEPIRREQSGSNVAIGGSGTSGGEQGTTGQDQSGSTEPLGQQG